MPILDHLAQWLGLSEPSTQAGASPPKPNTTAAPGAGHGGTPMHASQGVHDPYADLWSSVDQHLAEFMEHGVLPHLQYEPNDEFKLVRVQVSGTSAKTQDVVERFLKEFRPDSRRKVVLAAVNRNCTQGVSTNHFVDLNRDFKQADLEESDPYLAELTEADQRGYRVMLFGEWSLQQPLPPAASANPIQPSSGSHTVTVEVDDAKGKRTLQIPALPFVLGRESSVAEHALAGTYVSRRHGLFERDAATSLWYRDTSVNGSWLDGLAVKPGERRQLHDGSRLVLGGPGAGVTECPQIVVLSGAGLCADVPHSVTPLRGRMPEGAATPLRTDAATPAATPIAGPSSPGASTRPLCLLAIQDAQGSRTVAVTHVPYVIGRDEKADCRIPEGNAGVSRQHLVITAIDAAGAQLVNNGAEAQRWGTEVGGIEQGSRFALPWNARANLAHRYAHAPSVTVQLLTGNS